MANQYLLYKTRTPLVPFLIINPDTINDSSTSLTFIGQTLSNYGQIEQQDQLSLLENFANATAPSNAILGQEWFNTSDGNMYACTNENGQVFAKISKPIVSATTPTSGILTSGDLWFNTTTSVLNVLGSDNITWIAVGPISQVPLSVEQKYYMNLVTTNATPSELYVNGVIGNRLVITAGSSWLFKVTLIARVTESISEAIGITFSGILDFPTSGGSANIIGGIEKNLFGITSTLTGADANITADSVNNSLKITVTGNSGKTIVWNAVVDVVSVA